MKPALVALVLLSTAAVAFSGCSGSPDTAPVPSDSTSPSGSPEPNGPDGGNNTPPEPYSFDVYLTSGHGLSTEPQSAGTAVVDQGFLDPSFLAGNADIVPWINEGPLSGGVIVTALSLEVWYSSDAPQQEVGSAVGFSPLGIWYGEENRWNFDQLDGAPAQLTPGQVAHVTDPVDLPSGGLVYEKGATPAIIVGLFYTQNEGSPITVHTGGEMPSRLNVTVLPYDLPELGPVSPETHDGEFTYNSPFAPNPNADENTLTFDVEINDTVARLKIEADGENTAGNLDYDIYLVAPSGDQVQASTSPEAHEIIVMYDAQFAKIGYGTYEVRLVNFQSAKATYELDIEVVYANPQLEAVAVEAPV